MPALRLAAVTLIAADLAATERFYRWCLDLKPVPGPDRDGRELSWGREDRVLLASDDAGAEESLCLRMSTRRLEGVVGWCRESGVEPESVAVPPEDEAGAREAWPDRRVQVDAGTTTTNRIELRIRVPGGLAVALTFPLPLEVLVARGRTGPFAVPSGDRAGLEIPGLLGVRTGAPDASALRRFAARLGVHPMAGGSDEPLTIGDHQWIPEDRETPGIHGLAVLVREARLGAVQRTLAHMEVQHRLDGQRLLAADPEGRIVLIHGLRQG